MLSVGGKSSVGCRMVNQCYEPGGKGHNRVDSITSRLLQTMKQRDIDTSLSSTRPQKCLLG